MPEPAPAPPDRYPTVVRDVADVALVGAADAAPWLPLLQAASVRPFLADGRAEVQLLACSARFKGKRFRELSLSICVSDTADGSTRDGVYLATAFNSVRFFAWVERVFFGTPYAHADVRLEGEPLAAFRVAVQGREVLRAASVGGAHATETGEARWEGPIHLPPKRKGAPRRCFFGRLEGASLRHPFERGRDTLDVTPRSADDPLGLLGASGFEPRYWQTRTGAVHARSKTLRLT